MTNNDFELTIAQVIKKYGLLRDRGRAKKLGQHFLCDENLLDRIVSCAGTIGEDCDVVEIGPGPGGLTRSIIKHLKKSGKSKLFCIEKDETLKPVHDNLIRNAGINLEIIYGDAMKIRPQDLTTKRIVIISNLPYNVGTQIYLNWLSDLSRIDRLVLMFQKEVASRICAKIGSKDYGRLSVISQLLCKTEKLFDVSNKAFVPPPKVISSVIRNVSRETLKIEDFKNVEKLTELSFQYRRKMMSSVLKIGGYSNDAARRVLEMCGILKNVRPENISPSKFLELSRMLEIYAKF